MRGEFNRTEFKSLTVQNLTQGIVKEYKLFLLDSQAS